MTISRKENKSIAIVKNFLNRLFLSEKDTFSGSADYWEQRYTSGGNSGSGSYGKLAEFKAAFLNRFVRDHDVASVIEYGCGDGNQLALSDYPRYLGYDVSQTVLEKCRSQFQEDPTKEFRHVGDFNGQAADLALSLDVIFHLVEDDVFGEYMSRLFSTADRFVIIYSSNTDDIGHPTASHVRHREFTRWVQANAPQWSQTDVFKNSFPYDGDYENTSFADFYIFTKTGQ